MNTNKKYSPEVRERAVRLVHEQQEEHSSRRSAICSFVGEIGCTLETLRRWCKETAHSQLSTFGAKTESPRVSSERGGTLLISSVARMLNNKLTTSLSDFSSLISRTSRSDFSGAFSSHWRQPLRSKFLSFSRAAFDHENRHCRSVQNLHGGRAEAGATQSR